jgi:radical SAM superfamily enzyme YgiQ (UPF0313 family)
MKTLIVALNSKYIHSSLAPWYLKASCGEGCGEIKVREFSINDNIDAVLADIYKEKAEVVAFSCYIWNIGIIMKLAENLKKVKSDVKIVLGGPEVSFDAIRIIEDNFFVDFIVVGEGEKAFGSLIGDLNEKLGDASFLYEGKDAMDNEGVVSRNYLISNSKVKYQIIEDLESIPSPYSDEMLFSLGNKIVYFESSRGCPFSCSYCLSSTLEGVRYFSMDRVKRALTRIIDAGAGQIKFVDRTFNCNRLRAKEIFKFIINKGNEGIKTNFHFEVAADIFDDEMFGILADAPEGLIQFEIGVQTTNLDTLDAINRKTDLNKLFENVQKLKTLGKTHIHMDLIAGLPEEDIISFKKSFNDVYSFKPHQLQLGFLKLLKGSEIRYKAEQYDYKFREYPTYEVISNKFISFDEMLLLKDVEEMVERYYNSGHFSNTLKYLIEKFFISSFDFYERLSLFYRSKGFMEKPPSGRNLYTILNDFVNETLPGEETQRVNELLKLDFLASDNSNNLPEGIQREIKPGFKEWCFDFLKNEQNVKLYLPDYEGIPAKQIYKNVHFEIFNNNFFGGEENGDFKEEKVVVVFDYSKRSSVTGQYYFVNISDKHNGA